MTVHTDCVLRNAGRYEFIATTDIDEVILPQPPHNDYRDLMRHLIKQFKDKKQPVSAYLFKYSRISI